MRIKKLFCGIQTQKQEQKLACLCFRNKLTTTIKRKEIRLSSKLTTTIKKNRNNIGTSVG